MGAYLMETKVIQTVNDSKVIDSVNHRNSLFAWNVQNVQITHVKDSHLEFQENVFDIEIRSITETTEYATITYTRDRNLPHLMELRELEQRFDVLEDILKEQKAIKKANMPVLKFAIISVIGFLCCIGAGKTILPIALICGFGGLVLTVLLNAIRLPKAKAADDIVRKTTNEMKQIEEACKSLIQDMLK